MLLSQEGTFRSNCMDCLDRTNVIQNLLARRSLQSQLRVGPRDHIGHGANVSVKDSNDQLVSNINYVEVLILSQHLINFVNEMLSQHNIHQSITQSNINILASLIQNRSCIEWLCSRHDMHSGILFPLQYMVNMAKRSLNKRGR